MLSILFLSVPIDITQLAERFGKTKWQYGVLAIEFI